MTMPALERQPRLVHAFSTLRLGSMRDPEARHAMLLALGLAPRRLTLARVVHGVGTARVDAARGAVENVDILVTDRPGLPLMAGFADCYPLLLFDPAGRVALAHAGWRGTAAGVAGAAVNALEREYGSQPRQLLAGIGPGICGRCYEVGDEVAEGFSRDVVRPSEGGKYLLDLAEANRRALVNAGLDPDRVHLHGACTRETDWLPSHRRDADGRRFAAVVALRA
jgi:YfiH family protein